MFLPANSVRAHLCSSALLALSLNDIYVVCTYLTVPIIQSRGDEKCPPCCWITDWPVIAGASTVFDSRATIGSKVIQRGWTRSRCSVLATPPPHRGKNIEWEMWKTAALIAFENEHKHNIKISTFPAYFIKISSEL